MAIRFVCHMMCISSHPLHVCVSSHPFHVCDTWCVHPSIPCVCHLIHSMCVSSHPFHVCVSHDMFVIASIPCVCHMICVLFDLPLVSNPPPLVQASNPHPLVHHHVGLGVGSVLGSFEAQDVGWVSVYTVFGSCGGCGFSEGHHMRDLQAQEQRAQPTRHKDRWLRWPLLALPRHRCKKRAPRTESPHAINHHIIFKRKARTSLIWF